jgi:hypothetical protein
MVESLGGSVASALTTLQRIRLSLGKGLRAEQAAAGCLAPDSLHGSTDMDATH